MMNAIQKLSLELAAAERNRSPKAPNLFASRPRPERRTNRLQAAPRSDGAAPRRPARPRRG
jgi:hypothetical protein